MSWHVACAADEPYLGHSAAMVHSLLTTDPQHRVVVHLLHPSELPARNRRDMRAFIEGLGGEADLRAMDPGQVAGLPTMSRIPGVMWYRVFLPELLPDVDRVLYLDADTLVVDTVAPLWDEDLSHAYVAAVANVLEPQYADRPVALGLPVGQPYFNSGVLLLNLERMRNDDCTRRILDLARREPLLWPDQDALNVVLGTGHVSLHPRWNTMNSLYLFRRARDVFGAEAVRVARHSPAIVHFEGPDVAKPWHYLNKHPYREAYARHRAATPWPDFDIVGRTLPNRLLKPLPTRATLEVMGRWQWLRHRVLSRASPRRLRRGFRGRPSSPA